MALAEKIVTAVQRGTANTRWRDFADIYLLAGRHRLRAAELSTAISKVAEHRRAPMRRLAETLDGFAASSQSRWSAWVRRQWLNDRLPLSFAELLDAVQSFADPVISDEHSDAEWEPQTKTWRVSEGGR